MNRLLIVWGSKSITGIPILDEHHRSIISVMNSLFYSMCTHQGEHAVKPTVAILDQFSKLYFSTEEKLLLESKYHLYEEHIEKHTRIIEKIQSFASKNRYCDPAEVLAFLKFWLHDHIEIDDRAYADHVEAYLRRKNEGVSRQMHPPAPPSFIPEHNG